MQQFPALSLKGCRTWRWTEQTAPCRCLNSPRLGIDQARLLLCYTRLSVPSHCNDVHNRFDAQAITRGSVDAGHSTAVALQAQYRQHLPSLQQEEAERQHRWDAFLVQPGHSSASGDAACSADKAAVLSDLAAWLDVTRTSPEGVLSQRCCQASLGCIFHSLAGSCTLNVTSNVLMCLQSLYTHPALTAIEHCHL